MERFFENVFSGIGITDIVDILIVAFVIYKLLGLIKQTRAEQLLKGVLVLVVATFVTDLMNLHTINWLLKGTVALGAVAILVVFQPELRRALEYIFQRTPQLRLKHHQDRNSTQSYRTFQQPVDRVQVHQIRYKSSHN